MAIKHSVDLQRYQVHQKEANKAPFGWLRLSFVLAGIALVVGIVIFPQYMAILLLFISVLLFLATLMYAWASQRRHLIR